MSQLTLQDCITSKTRKAGDQIGRVMAALERAVDDEHFAYLTSVDSGDSASRRRAHANWTQAQHCLDAAKSAL